MIDKTLQQAEMLANRVRKNARHLRKWARREGVTCYRLYDRDIPEIPLVIDWYDGRLHAAEYAAGDRDAGDGWAEQMLCAAARALEVSGEKVFLKTRERQRGDQQYTRFDRKGTRFEIDEGGHRFYVNLSDYLDTGLFLDHRITRARVESEAGGRRVLNLYCYTGSFTVYAAAGGAASTTSVDLSNTYLGWARDNLSLNGLSGPVHRTLRADVMEFLTDARSRGERFDLIVIDPPTFSNSKRMTGVLDVRRDHPELIRRALAVSAPGGVIYFSTNSRRFHLDEQSIRGATVEDITASTIPPDFRGKRPHQCWRLLRQA